MCFHGTLIRFAVLASLLLSSGVRAGGVPGSIPSAAPGCGVDAPPPDAGAYVTPGGFLLVYPRNAALPDNYSGCKTLWVVQGPGSLPRLMRLYFREGRLTAAEAYDGRGGGAPSATCSAPFDAPGCEGVADSPLTALRLATWPRLCIDNADAPACSAEPE